MPVRTGEAEWKGTLKEGEGRVRTETGALDGPYSFNSRAAEGKGTNPEELIGAAHAGCFSMFLSALLSKDGYTPTRIDTTAKVYLEAGPTIAKIELTTRAAVPGLDADKLQEYANNAKAGCPVSKALASVEIVLNAALA